MKIFKFTATNYRSIEKCTIHFNDQCKILLGINESGKSNILKALKSLDKDFEFNYQDDTKNSIDTEQYSKSDPKFKYEFLIPKEKIKEILEKIFESDYEEWPFEINDSKLNKIAQAFSEKSVTYEITYNVENNRDTTSYYPVLHDLVFKEHIYVALSNFKADLIDERSCSYNEKDWVFLNIDEVVESQRETIRTKLQSIDKEYVNKKIGAELCSYMKKNLPNVVYWEYDPSQLLNSTINIDSFIQSPDSCLPLKHIFMLSGIEKISEAITHTRNNESGFHNLLEKLGEAATRHINNIWKDYKNIQIIIKSRNNDFAILVKDKKNLYSFKNRSDGFRRFISFLLLLSAKDKTSETFKNNLILFDEPEIGIHPSGIRHLLEELLCMSKKNYCVLATHSIFLIDKENLGRHLIIEKENESTVVKVANHQNFSEEEVLYNALGFTTFDILKDKNLFFEGWTDKEIFKILFNHFAPLTNPKFSLEQIGISWSSKASKICLTLAPLINLPNKYYLVIADHDKPGLEEQNEFNKTFSKTSSRFFTYKEIISSKKSQNHFELEDILPEKIIIDAFNSILQTNKKDQLTFTKSDFRDVGVLRSWDSFIHKNFKEDVHILKISDKGFFVEQLIIYLENNPDPLNNKVIFKDYLKLLNKVISLIQK